MKIGWLGKNGVHGTNLLDRIMSVFGCLKPVRDSDFQSRPAFFRFSRALLMAESLHKSSGMGGLPKIIVIH